MRPSIHVDPAERIAGLLESNNRYLMRARAAEAKCAVLALALEYIVDAARQDPAEEPTLRIIEIAGDALTEVERDTIPKLVALVDLVEVAVMNFADLDHSKLSTTLIAAALNRIMPSPDVAPEEAADLEAVLRNWQADQAFDAAA